MAPGLALKFSAAAGEYMGMPPVCILTTPPSAIICGCCGARVAGTDAAMSIPVFWATFVFGAIARAAPIMPSCGIPAAVTTSSATVGMSIFC